MYLFSFSASYVCLTLVVDSANFEIQKKCHLQLIMRSILLYWLFGLVGSSVIEMIIVVPISCWFDGCTYTFLGMQFGMDMGATEPIPIPCWWVVV